MMDESKERREAPVALRRLVQGLIGRLKTQGWGVPIKSRGGHAGQGGVLVTYTRTPSEGATSTQHLPRKACEGIG